MPDTLIAGGNTPASDWDGALSALESRAEIDSLEDLQQRRRELIKKHGRLLALHGAFGLFDDYRKSRVEAQKIVARRAMEQRGEKPTDKSVEAEAYGSPEYQQVLDNAITDKIDALTVQNEIDELNERIKNRESSLYVFGQEMKLAR